MPNCTIATRYYHPVQVVVAFFDWIYHMPEFNGFKSISTRFGSHQGLVYWGRGLTINSLRYN